VCWPLLMSILRMSLEDEPSVSGVCLGAWRTTVGRWLLALGDDKARDEETDQIGDLRRNNSHQHCQCTGKNNYGTALSPLFAHRCGQDRGRDGVCRKPRTVLKIRLNTNGWDETQPLKKRSAS
jgi:hypothetical protein